MTCDVNSFITKTKQKSRRLEIPMWFPVYFFIHTSLYSSNWHLEDSHVDFYGYNLKHVCTTWKPQCMVLYVTITTINANALLLSSNERLNFSNDLNLIIKAIKALIMIGILFNFDCGFGSTIKTPRIQLWSLRLYTLSIKY